MPLPPDDELDAKINELFDAVMDRVAEPGRFGAVTAQSGRLQAASQRRLVLAIERATKAQEQTNETVERLERVGIAVAVVGVLLGAVQIWVAVGSPRLW
jgi:hypothetical protein